MRRIPFAWLVFLAAAVGLGGAIARATPREDPAADVPADHQEAVERGLAYLVRPDVHQRSGAFLAEEEVRIPVTALAGLALLGAGNTPRSGPHADHVRATVEYLLRSQLRSGLIAGGRDPRGVDSRVMYGHGFATLFLAECYGAAGDPTEERRLERALRKAVDEISAAQSENGGWYYTPQKHQDEASVTITQIQALRAARNAGIRVEKSVVDRAIAYVRRSQNADGGVRYDLLGSGPSSLALTGAGLAVFFGAGEYEGPHVDRALRYINRRLDTGEGWSDHYEYTHFYLAQALHQAGGAEWARYYPRIRAELLRRRRSDGSWPETSGYGPVYGTALSLLVLEIPYRYLPIYER